MPRCPTLCGSRTRTQLLAVGVGRDCLDIFLCRVISSSLSLSLEDGSIQTEILTSRSTVKQPINVIIGFEKQNGK